MYIPNPTSSNNHPPPPAIIDLFKNVRTSDSPNLAPNPNRPLILTTEPFFLSSSDLPLPALSPLVFFLIALLSAFIVTLVIRVAMLAQRRRDWARGKRARWQRDGCEDEDEDEDEGEYADAYVDEEMEEDCSGGGLRMGMDPKGSMGLQRGKIFLGADKEVGFGVSIPSGERVEEELDGDEEEVEESMGA